MVNELRESNDKAFESNARLSAIMEAFEGLIYVCSPDYRIVYINEQMIKRKRFDLKAERCYTALHGRTAPCPFCVLNQVMQGRTVKFEMKDPCDKRWYYSANTPVFHQDGSLSMLSMITDINSRKTAEFLLKEKAIQLRRENIFLRSGIRERYRFGDIIGKSAPMQDVYEQILNAAATDAGVILLGEPGSGKELVAQAIHQTSKRADKRFVPVHCGAIPEQLFESEFFGYKKGAFSGANEDRQGYLDVAHGGTLFLDEIGEISQAMQMKLLRAIEGGGYTPVGSNQIKTSEFRIIAATNRDIQKMLENGSMRQDFYFRINILPVRLPSLRERKEDIPLLADHFLQKHGGGDRSLTDAPVSFYEVLHRYDWPGNVRELQNAMLRFCATRSLDFIRIKISETDGVQDGAAGQSESELKTLREYVSELEKRVISQTLTRNQWRRGETASMLGIDRKTLAVKIRRYRLNRS